MTPKDEKKLVKLCVEFFLIKDTERRLRDAKRRAERCRKNPPAFLRRLSPDLKKRIAQTLSRRGYAEAWPFARLH